MLYSESETLQRRLNTERANLEQMRKNYASLEQQIAVERAATETEKKNVTVLKVLVYLLKRLF